MKKHWKRLSLVQRIRLLRYIMPLVFIPVVVGYQLQIAFRLEEAYGEFVHYASEISFYAFVGPVVTWMILIWVERRLEEKDALEHEVRRRTDELAALLTASPDAILSLDASGMINSWNRGAERLFGFTEEDMIGRPVQTLIPDALHLLKIPPGMGPSFEATAYNQQGLPLRVDLTQAVLEKGQDREVDRLLILRDITLRSERAAVQEEERSRIARDLHDGLAQNLYFLALKADMARAQIETDPAAVQSSLGEIGSQARKAIREVRRAIFGLKPITWEPGAFLKALETFVSDFGREAQFQTTYHAEINQGRLPPRLELLVFRFVQESLNNVAKHAGARHVDVRIETDPPGTKLLVRITDDGTGFNSDDQAHGFGLSQMEERFARLKGAIRLSSSSGRGTIVEAHLPLNSEGEQNGSHKNFTGR